MRRPILLALTSAAAMISAAPLMADHHKETVANEPAPVAVSLSADEVLAPYYTKLRESIDLPQAGEGPTLDPATRLTRIAFGSCNHQSASQHIWDQVASANPQLFMMIGDNIYGDNAWDGDAELESVRAAYALQASHPEWQRLRAAVPMLATWDDHDYGLNDAGAAFPMRRWSETMFEHFWGSTDAVQSRPGVYDSVTYGPAGERVQIILLDTRFFRSDLKRMDWSRERPPLGGYLPDDSPEATVLGAAQWEWLQGELAKPADLRIVVSSIQVLTEAHNYESWENFPKEREKLLEMIGARADSGVVLLSGDRHAAGIYKIDDAPGGGTLWELTSSALNLAFGDGDIDKSSAREPDPKRTTPFFAVENYGLVDIDWRKKQVTMTLKGDTSQTYAEQSFKW